MNITPASNAALPVAAAPTKPSVDSTAPKAAVPAQAEKNEPAIVKAKLQAPEKVDLGFSAKEMRQNIQEAR